MTENEKAARVVEVVGHFATEFWRSREWQLGQILIEAQLALSPPAVSVPVAPGEWFSRSMEPQEWLTMARAAVGLVPATDDNRGYVREICQSLAEWLFVIPGGSLMYSIPAEWYETEMGALWAAALIWCEGDELITLAEAAAISGVPVKTLSSRADRGKLRTFIDPLAPPRQGRRLVSRRSVEGG